MEPVLKWIAVAALGSVTFAGVSIGYVALEFRDTPAAVNAQLASGKRMTDTAGDLEDSVNAVTVPAVNKLVGTATTAAGTANGVLKAAKTSVDTVNAKEGILYVLRKNLVDMRLGIDNFNAVAIKERQYLEVEQPALVTQATALMGHASDAIAAATTAANNANAAMPYIRETMQNTAAATAAAVPLIQNANGIVADGKVQADRLTYPTPQPWYKRIGHFALGTGKLVYDFYFR